MDKRHEHDGADATQRPTDAPDSQRGKVPTSGSESAIPKQPGENATEQVDERARKSDD